MHIGQQRGVLLCSAPDNAWRLLLTWHCRAHQPQPDPCLRRGCRPLAPRMWLRPAPARAASATATATSTTLRRCWPRTAATTRPTAWAGSRTRTGRTGATPTRRPGRLRRSPPACAGPHGILLTIHTPCHLPADMQLVGCLDSTPVGALDGTGAAQHKVCPGRPRRSVPTCRARHAPLFPLPALHGCLGNEDLPAMHAL